MFAEIHVANADIVEFQDLVRTTAAEIWAQDENGVYTKSFGDSPILQKEVKTAVKASTKFKAYFEGPQASLWEKALHEHLKR